MFYYLICRISSGRMYQFIFPLSAFLLSITTAAKPLSVTFVTNAVQKGAVWLDGSPTAYYFSPGFGSGVNNWVVHMYHKKCGKSSHRLVEHITNESVGVADVIVMSCHVASHWVLLVANLEDQSWDFYDSMPNPTHMTPLRDHMRYLQEDTFDVLPADIAKWPLHTVTGLPTQETGNDCGIFVMKYMEAIVVSGPVDWSTHSGWGKDMPRIRATIVAAFCRIFQSSLLKDNGFNY